MPMSDADQNAIIREQERLKNDLKAIRNNPRLSESGKRAEIADAYKRARDVTRGIRDRVKAENARKRADLEPILFGVGSQPSGSDLLAYRDAMDRATACKSAGDLTRLMEGARLSGDKTLAKACFATAWQRADNTVGRGYIELVDGVLATDQATARLAERYGEHLDETSFFPDITKPGELAGIDVDRPPVTFTSDAATA